MEAAIHDLKSLNFQNRTVAVVDNGSWANVAGKTMRSMLSEIKNITLLEDQLSLVSTLKKDQMEQLNQMANSIISSYFPQ